MNTDEYMGHIAATRKGIETYHGSALGSVPSVRHC